MKLWKEQKVNPFGSCLPLLIQLPILLALFYVVQEGLQIDANRHLLYGFLKDAYIFIDPFLFSILDLRIPNIYVLPLIVGGLQYYQMMITLPPPKPSEDKTQEFDQAAFMNKTMKYIMPVMIAIFTASLPAAVGLFWGTSTLFAIIQQWVIIKKKPA